MKKTRALCIFLALMISACWLLTGLQVKAEDQSVFSGCHSVDALQQLGDGTQLTETAKAAIVYELGSDTMIYAWNPDTRIYPASMVKLMTALVALENGQLEDTVIVTRRALNEVQIGSVSANLKAGEELTLEDLLYCMMAASANDAATVIAEHIGGTQAGFIKMMNERAKELGCTGTNYTNAHGLHDENNYTTARDVCRLLDTALENPVFRQMFEAESYTVPTTNKSDAREIYTSNDMMSQHGTKKYYDERVTGGKTGATDEAGRCLAATAKGGGMELLTIVMGAEPTYEDDTQLSLKTFGSYEETRILLDHTLENFQCRQLFYEGQVVAQYPVVDGTNSVVVQPASEVYTVLPAGIEEEKLTWIYAEAAGTITAPVEKGQKISSVQVWYGSKCLAQTDLVAVNGVQKWQEPTVPQQTEDTGGEEDLKWIGIVCGILLLVAAVVSLAVVIRKAVVRAMRNARLKRRRRNRRRSR